MKTVRPRKGGREPWTSWALSIPSWLAREIAQSYDPKVIDERLRDLEFLPSKVPEGILFRVVGERVVVVNEMAGWPESPARPNKDES